jgi:hypothetical protein
MASSWKAIISANENIAAITTDWGVVDLITAIQLEDGRILIIGLDKSV